MRFSRTSISLILLASALTFGTSGCKSKKKLAEEKARQEMMSKIAQAKATLEQLMQKKNTTLEQVASDEAKLNEIRTMGLQDGEVQALIAKVDAKLQADKEAIKAALAKAEAERLAKEKENMANTQEAKDIYYFLDQITGAGQTAQANALINDALKLFASPEVPVLIEIFNDGTDVDYDKPTTIKRYLEYLKDVKRKPDTVKNFKKDGNGKITELILTKIKY